MFACLYQTIKCCQLLLLLSVNGSSIYVEEKILRVKYESTRSLVCHMHQFLLPCLPWDVTQHWEALAKPLRIISSGGSTPLPPLYDAFRDGTLVFILYFVDVDTSDSALPSLVYVRVGGTTTVCFTYRRRMKMKGARDKRYDGMLKPLLFALPSEVALGTHDKVFQKISS